MGRDDMGIGTNISHWLSQSRLDHEQRKTFFTRDDVRQLADWGFDHLRLPIDESVMYDQADQADPRAWAFMDRAIDWASEAGMKVIVDLHILRGHHFHEDLPALFTDDAAVARFVTIWRELADHPADRPTDAVAFELLNEPKAPDNASWNRVWREAYQAIRATQPDRTIVIGPNHYQIAPNAPDLAIGDDGPQIVSFHFYGPMAVTHYRASWAPPLDEYDGPVRYPGQPIADADLADATPAVRRMMSETDANQPFDPNAMRALIEPALKLRERTGVRLHCGEFGCRTIVPLETRRRWYGDLIGLFVEHEIGYANWDYRGGFGLIDADGNPTGVLEIITQSARPR